MFLKLPCHYQSLEYRLWLMWRSLKIYFLQMSDLGSRENWIEFSLNNHIGSRMAALVPISSKILLPTCFASKVVWFFYKLLQLFWNTLRSTFQLQKKCRYLINPRDASECRSKISRFYVSASPSHGLLTVLTAHLESLSEHKNKMKTCFVTGAI